MGEMHWYWEDYEERNYDSEENKKKVVSSIPAKTPTHCEKCQEALKLNEHKSNKHCNACYDLETT